MSAFAGGVDVRLVPPKHRIVRQGEAASNGLTGLNLHRVPAGSWVIWCACRSAFFGTTRFASLSAFYAHALLTDRQEDAKS